MASGSGPDLVSGNGLGLAPGDGLDQAATAGTVRVYAVGDRLADRDGSLRRAYRARPGTVAVIRPDGHLGLLDDNPDSGTVRDYLIKISLRARELDLGVKPRRDL